MTKLGQPEHRVLISSGASILGGPKNNQNSNILEQHEKLLAQDVATPHSLGSWIWFSYGQ